ncbi:hypothetical protein ACTU6V_06445 [Microbacterium sp. A204]|uniref:hypothetical protein n=1 Tax=Microbacterium sp. A204 TaxID=3457321 RepID=UPI003FD2BDA1
MCSEPVPEPVEGYAELRMLRAKAYGQGDGLSSEELTRLRELEGWGTIGADASGSVPEPEVSVPEPVEGPRGSVDASTDSAIGAVEAPRRPRRWPILLATAAGLLAVGLGIGWGIWGWDSEASALAAAHGDTQAELEARQDYDLGTVVPVAEEHGVVVWRADRSDGEELCVIITGPKTEARTGCVTRGDMDNYAWPSATGTVPEGADKAGQQLTASLIPATNGEIVPFIQVWDMDRNWEAQYTEDELAQLHSVEAAGYMGSALSILGYDGDTVVWSSWETGMLCVIASTDAHNFAEACAEGPDEMLTLSTEVDGTPTRYVVTQSEMRSPQLTVYKDVDAEYYFGADDPSSIDDKTGQ